MSLIERFSDNEDYLIRRFHAHPFFWNFSNLTNDELKYFLLQKTFLSFNFPSWYDRAILTLNDEEAKQVLKKILQDETPVGLPSHRQDLLADLEYIGISRKQALTVKPTEDTLRTLDELNSLVAYSDHPDHDLKVMSALRIAGEILVAEEYRHVVPALEYRFGLTPEKSRFYAPHFYHDRKDSETGTHTHSFEGVLGRLITSEEKLKTAKAATYKAFEAREGFYYQFTGTYWEKVNSTVAASLRALGLPIVDVDVEYEYARFIQLTSDEFDSVHRSKIPINRLLLSSLKLAAKYTLKRQADDGFLDEFEPICKKDILKKFFSKPDSKYLNDISLLHEAQEALKKEAERRNKIH